MKIQEIHIKDNFKSIIFLGDLHSNFSIISYYIKKFKIKNTAFLQVGDFGVGFFEKKEEKELYWLNKTLVANKCKLFVIRGNHDDPLKFNNKYLFSNIFMIDDWTIMNINHIRKERILCIGGAISIDRLNSKIKNSWFKDEEIKWDNDIKTFDEIKEITILMTHTAPDYVEPYFMGPLVQHYAKKDLTLIEELNKERRLMSYLFDCIKKNNKESLKNYFYGHFHFNNTIEYDEVIFKLLAINEMYELI